MPNTISPKIRFKNKDKLKAVNPETIKLWNKYKIDMTLRELSPKTISAYENDFYPEELIIPNIRVKHQQLSRLRIKSSE